MMARVERQPFGIVLADANVLYSRVLRDYLLHAMSERLIRVRWSDAILAEVVRHLGANIEAFDDGARRRLLDALNLTFPDSRVDVGDSAIAAVAQLSLPDEDDRHVLAAAVASEASIVCTDNVRDFPTEAVAPLGLTVMTPDALLTRLITERPDEMLTVHRAAVRALRGSTNTSRLATLERAGAVNAARALRTLVGRSEQSS